MYRDLISTVVDYDAPLFRNIKGIRETQVLFDDLGDDDLDQEFAAAGENLAKEPTDEALISRPIDYGKFISFPFTQIYWQESRFSDGRSFGVWYGSEELETTVHESVYHWRRFIQDSFPGEKRSICGERRVFKVHCQGILVSLLGKEEQWPALRDPKSYKFTQGLGAYLKGQNQNGLLTRSARCEGINAAIFNPDILSNPLDVCFLTYRFNPVERGPVLVERTKGTVWLAI